MSHYTCDKGEMPNRNPATGLSRIANRYGLLLVCLLGISSGLDARERSVLIGNESFLWYETADDGSRYLTENGNRYVLGLKQYDHKQTRSRERSFVFYGGIVHYDGQLMDGTPFVSSTGYDGIRLDSLWQHQLFNTSVLFAEYSLGLDIWRRVLDNGGSLGYTETFHVLQSRVGLGFDFDGWYVKGGVKLPWVLVETVSLGLTLYPSPQSTTYFELGLGQPDGLQLRLTLDGYRLMASPEVQLMGQSYYQPNSVQNSLVLSLHVPI
ncbi:MAG: hypothetical protein HUJ29_04170 [Gammaproteobacteria bacterium]|nr:hypothetical protein [Gammaproteobacteria bacterium]